MQLIPVIDYQAGRVVRAVGGRRSEYRPLTSRITNAVDPLEVAMAIRAHFGFTELYFADLDAIAGGPPAFNVYRELRDAGFRLWLDSGIRSADDATAITGHADVVIAGLESVDSADHLQRITWRLRTLKSAASIAFSLDLSGGQPVCDVANWRTEDPVAIARHAIESGVDHVIVLDLARVGERGGTGTDAICSALATKTRVIAGGGVRGNDDIRRLESIGVSAALIATAIHDGVDLR